MACLCHGGNGSWKHRPTGGCGLEGTLSSGAAPGQGPGLHGAAFQGKPPCQAPPEHVATGLPGIPDLSPPLCCTQGLLLTPWDPGQQHSGPALSSARRSPNEIPQELQEKGGICHLLFPLFSTKGLFEAQHGAALGCWGFLGFSSEPGTNPSPPLPQNWGNLNFQAVQTN